MSQAKGKAAAAAAASTTAICPPVPAGEHALQTAWTLYFDKKLQRNNAAQASHGLEDYKQNIKKLGSFNSLEGFWRHYAYLQSPDDLPKDHDIFMFRDDKIPAWETFPNGGCWIIKVRKRNGIIPRLWEELMFACVGELFEEPGLAGVVLSTRSRDDLLSVWNSDNAANPETRFKIGECLKEILNLDETTKVEYKYFSHSMKDGSTFRNARTYIYAAQYDGDKQQQQGQQGQGQQQQQGGGKKDKAAAK